MNMENTTKTTDVDDVETRDLIEKGYALIKALKDVELRDPENVLRTMLEKLDEFRCDWCRNAYAHGWADAKADSLGEPQGENVPKGC